MTHSGDFVKFIVSRLLSGLFGAVPSAVGGSMILDVFFLHNRGRAFICYETAILFGATSGPTFSGFIAGKTTWTACFWWTVALLSIVSIAVFVFAGETAFDREKGVAVSRVPEEFAKSRIALFFPGTRAVATPSWNKAVSNRHFERISYCRSDVHGSNLKSGKICSGTDGHCTLSNHNPLRTVHTRRFRLDLAK